MRDVKLCLRLSLLVLGGCSEVLFGDLDDYTFPVETAGFGCTNSTYCPSDGNDCTAPVCLNGVCGTVPVAAGTPTQGQQPGDCMITVCDGNGGKFDIPDKSDMPNDSNECTQDMCLEGQPQFNALEAGTVCYQGSGQICDGAGACVECNVNAECASNVCRANICQGAQCDDLTKNGTETDIDCGGVGCSACVSGKACDLNTDCTSMLCGPNKVCTDSTCGNAMIEGDEACDDGATTNNDGCSATCAIESGYACVGVPSLCVWSCGNGVFDANEQCDDANLNSGDGCSSICNRESGWVCVGVPSLCVWSCGNGVIEGDEQCDDANGSNGDGCSILCDVENGFTCNGSPSVCTSTCYDLTQNGNETDTDCGGPTCPDCVNGDSCIVNSDCSSNYCNAMMTCAAPTCMDAAKNGIETDVDCGGGTCSTCANGLACNANTDCMSGICYGGTCVADVNGCTPANATDLTAVSTTTVTFANGNFTYAPKCIKVKVGTTVTLNGNFGSHPTIGGTVVGNVVTPATSGPFIPVTNTGTTKNFVMSTVGTFPYYVSVLPAPS